MVKPLTLIDGEAFVAGEVTVDTAALAEIIKAAFLLSMDGRLSESARGSLNASGIALRRQLMALLEKIFTAGNEPLQRANRTIADVNAELTAALADIDRAAATVEQLGALVSQLDTLLKIAGVVL